MRRRMIGPIIAERRVERLFSSRLLSDGDGPPPDASSRADAVVDSLSRSIASGDLLAGAPLSVTDLARRLDVAAATVRSALITLEAMHLVEHRPNRASVVVTPTPSWFVAVAAACSGLSVAAVELGIAQATDEQIVEFARRAAEVTELWSDEERGQIVGAEALWGLLELLATFSRNRHLASMHAEKRTALVLGMRSLARRRNPVMLRSAVDALVVAVQERDPMEAADIVRDLHAFVVDSIGES